MEVTPEPEGVIVPYVGQLVDVEDVDGLVRALATVKEMEARLATARRSLAEEIVRHSGIRGSKTITLEDGRGATVSGGPETVYHAEEIEAELREAGMPEERIREIVEERVTYAVKAVEAKRAAAANPVYAEIIARHRHIVPKNPSVSVTGFHESPTSTGRTNT